MMRRRGKIQPAREMERARAVQPARGIAHTRRDAFTLILTIATIVGIGLIATIQGSKHDFSHKEWSEGDACGACHTPHRAVAPNAAPLWNPNADLKQRFGTALALGTDAKHRKRSRSRLHPGSGTLMCIRCHDGTIATETITGVRATRFQNRRHPAAYTVGHGRSDHPVGIDFPQFDAGFRPLTAVVASGAVRLPDGKVECVSCHDPHNQAGQPHMLVTSNARSALCLTCHKK